MDFRGHRPSHPGSGFTLLEMVVAVIVLLVLAALMFNPMKNFMRRLSLNTSANAMRDLLSAARSRAMADPMAHCGVYFDIRKSPQQAIAFLDDFNPEDYLYDDGKDKPYLKPILLKKDLRIGIPKGYPNEVIFRGDGSAYLSGLITITDGVLTDTLDVLASTGRIKVMR